MGAGAAFAKNALQDYGTACGAEYRYGLSLVKLLKDQIGVCGAIARYEESGDYVRINAKNVIIATGGYHSNDEMMQALQPQNYRDYCINVGIMMAQGDGIKACMWAGAALDPTQQSMVFDRGVIAPDDGAGELRHKQGRRFTLGSQPWLKVNMYGERFTNESAPYDYVLHSSDYFPGRCLCLEELAEGLHIDPATFVKTVERYNELCEQGFDEDFGKEPYRMIALKNPPFYGARQSGMIGCTISGVLIDTDMRVLDAERNPIPGLYAAGVDTGGYFGHTYYNLTDSSNGGRCCTQGRHAGQMAATHDREECLARRIVIDPVVEESAPADLTYTDGLYEGTATSQIGGELTVYVTVENGAIAGVEVAHNETGGIGGVAIPELVSQTVAANCEAVEAVTGATITSEAYVKALVAALEAAR